jgi:hypothetical protein
MIGKITIRKSFKGYLLYCLRDKKLKHVKEHVMEGRAEIVQIGILHPAWENTT